MNNFGVFHLPDGFGPQTAALCPLVPGNTSSSYITHPRYRDSISNKVSCPGLHLNDDNTPSWKGKVPATIGFSYTHASVGVAEPPQSTLTSFVSAIECLNTACTDVVVGGRFNMAMGVEAHSVARLRFSEDFFYSQRSVVVVVVVVVVVEVVVVVAVVVSDHSCDHGD